MSCTIQKSKLKKNVDIMCVQMMPEGRLASVIYENITLLPPPYRFEVDLGL